MTQGRDLPPQVVVTRGRDCSPSDSQTVREDAEALRAVAGARGVMWVSAALKGHNGIAQGATLGSMASYTPSPERAKHRRVHASSPALAGLGNLGAFNPRLRPGLSHCALSGRQDSTGTLHPAPCIVHRASCNRQPAPCNVAAGNPQPATHNPQRRVAPWQPATGNWQPARHREDQHRLARSRKFFHDKSRLFTTAVVQTADTARVVLLSSAPFCGLPPSLP